MMGASKRIMELFLMKYSNQISISTSRFANVAFSDGSLLHGFTQRYLKKQPIVAPDDIRRYFVTPKESGEFCLMSCIFGENTDVFFPNLSEDDSHLKSFSDIAVQYIENLGFEPFICETETEARENFDSLYLQGKWPCLFSKSDNFGEKDIEEFYRNDEIVDLDTYNSLGVINNNFIDYSFKIDLFKNSILEIKNKIHWKKKELVDLFNLILPEFNHKETGKYLDFKIQ